MGFNFGSMMGAVFPTFGSGLGDLFGGGRPDYSKLANQQANANKDLLDQQTRANRPNQANPWGSSSWTQGADGQWSQNVQFSPFMDSIIGQAKTNLSQPMDWNTPGIDPNTVRDDVTKASFDRFRSLMDPVWNQREDSTRATMAAQGWDPNAQGVSSEWSRLNDQRGEDYSRGAWDSILQGGQEADRALNQRSRILAERSAQRTQPISEAGALMGLTPNFGGFSQAGYTPGPDLLGAAQMQSGANAQGQAAGAQNIQAFMSILPYLMAA